MQVQTLQPLRFLCLACGSCCHGVKVELDGPEEEARITRIAAEMGVDDPIVDGTLRQDGGVCPFLSTDNRCGIHAAHGSEAKPLACRQFPFILLDTESGMRAGVDPSSFNTLKTWHTAPPYADAVGHARKSRLDPSQVRAEQAIVAWCTVEGATVASVLGKLCGDGSAAPDLPPGFASRLITRLQKMHLGLILQARDGGPAQRGALQPLVEAIEGFDPGAPPTWPALAPNEDAFAVEVARRMVFLRLTSRIPIVQGAALLILGGAVAIAWAMPDPERFGPAMASWSRLIRGGTFWQSITPTPALMQWLARGDG